VIKKIIIVILSVFITTSSYAGNSLDFDGVSDYLQITSFAHNIGAGSFTWMAWVNTDDSTTNYLGIMSSGSFDPNMTTDSSDFGNQWGAYWNGVLNSGSSLTTGVWVHLVFQRDGTTINFFEDGVQTANTWTEAESIPNTDFEIGRNGTAAPLNGRMAYARVYNRALSLAEINTAMHCTDEPVSGLIANWKLIDSGTPSSYKDFSGNGHDAGVIIAPVESSDGPPTSACGGNQ